MQKLLTKNNSTNTNVQTKKLKFNDILKFYTKKDNSLELIGLEYERLSLDKKTFKNTDYKTIEKVIEHICSILDLELVYDGETIIQANSKDGTSISLEPGKQFEISLKPMESILDIDVNLTKIVNLLDKIADIYNVLFLPYGITPSVNCDEIEILAKKRYEIMYNHLPNAPKGELAAKMMKKTAGIQINIDYKDEIDAFYKLKFLNMIMPFVSALCANSPVENNVLTDFKSNRSYVWLFTGEKRCNFFYKNIFRRFVNKKDIFKNYIKEVLKVPMIFIERDNKNIVIDGKITFEEFLKDGFMGYDATLEDYILHQSLCFPDIRLKKYIEIRNHDSSDTKMALSLCAFYKGLMKSNIKKLIKKFKFIKLNEIENYSRILIKEGLSAKIGNKTGWQVIEELFNISKNNLNSKEKSYLTKIDEIIKLKKTQADIIQEFEIKNTEELVEFLTK